MREKVIGKKKRANFIGHILAKKPVNIDVNIFVLEKRFYWRWFYLLTMLEKID
jgi:hypothetical protein